MKHVERQTARLQCKVKNPKDYPITWLKNGQPIDESDPRYEIVNDKPTHALIIKNLKTDDEAVYTCKIGDRETKAKLMVDIGEYCK